MRQTKRCFRTSIGSRSAFFLSQWWRVPTAMVTPLFFVICAYDGVVGACDGGIVPDGKTSAGRSVLGVRGAGDMKFVAHPTRDRKANGRTVESPAARGGGDRFGPRRASNLDPSLPVDDAAGRAIKCFELLIDLRNWSGDARAPPGSAGEVAWIREATADCDFGDADRTAGGRGGGVRVCAGAQHFARSPETQSISRLRDKGRC